MRLVIALACAALLVCFGALPGHAEKRVALVIGNGAYATAPRLPNPHNDAEDVAASLKRAGFETVVGLDLDKAGMDDATIRFARAVRDADVALFYYSGHAMQFAGVNYLMPVDAKLSDEADLRRMTRVDEVVADLQQARTVRMLVLDSCRDNPLAEDLKRSIGLSRAASLQRGLARIDTPQGMIVAFATQAGHTAADGTDRNSPYTAAFLRHIEAAEEIGTVFRHVSADVYEATKHVQIPELSLSMIGEFYLHGRAAADAPARAGPDDSERAWAAVKDTTSIAVLEAFIRQYGDGLYASFARARLEELKRAGTPPRVEETKPPREARLTEPADPLRLDLVTDCDRLAASPYDPQRAKSVTGVATGHLDVVPALTACNQAVSQYPDIARFSFQLGRVVHEQKDYARERQLYERAIAAGSVAAMTNLGALYDRAYGVAQDYVQARRWYEKAAAAGHAFAMNNLGALYNGGRGVVQDYSEAWRWYEKAAGAGLGIAMSNLGSLYTSGKGVSLDYAEARRWFEKAVAAGEARGMVGLGSLYQNGHGVTRDNAEARRWYEKAAAAGEPRGMNALGFLYENGFGVPQSYADARRWFEKAAALGDARGMSNVGVLYYNGHGVAQDYAEARRWYEKGAAGGDALSYARMGFLYAEGKGVAQDFVQARRWYEKAIAEGDATGMNNFGALYANGHGVAQDYAEARRWYEKSASLGGTMAMRNLGDLYRDGKGVGRSPNDARSWYEKAASAGDAAAKERLRSLWRPNRR